MGKEKRERKKGKEKERRRGEEDKISKSEHSFFSFPKTNVKKPQKIDEPVYTARNLQVSNGSDWSGSVQ